MENAYEFHPLTPDRWADFEALFGERGACGGCWCMWWKLARSEFERSKGLGNRTAMHALVEAGETPGLLAYDPANPAGGAVGWCALAPREKYPVLGRSRILKPVDENPVWSVTCFFVAKPYRTRGLTVDLLGAAIDFAAKSGAHILEGYPISPKTGKVPAPFAYTGFESAFRKAGFVEVLRRSETRPIMRYSIEDQ